MKMKIEDYDLLVEALRPHDTEKRRERYMAGDFGNAHLCRDLTKRYRWDLFYGYHPTNFPSRMYALGLSDNHIETALAKFIPSLSTILLQTAADGSYIYWRGKDMGAPELDPEKPSAAQLSREQRYAVREAEEIAHSDEFFAARPGMDTIANRNLFRHGYFRGYDKGQGHL